MSSDDPKTEPIADAYRLMAMDSAGHVWSKFARHEVDAILARFPLAPRARIVDVGCGSGRHSLEFAQRGFKVQGFDFVSDWITRAQASATSMRVGIDQSGGELRFDTADARDMPLMEGHDLVVCLYDVLGSSPDYADARRLVQSLFRLCKPGSAVVLGCMNGMQMVRRLGAEGMLRGKPNLTDMKPLSGMQRCGEVFHFEHMRYDPGTGILYRREQFAEAGRAASDLLIEERRFLPAEVVQLLAEAGFEQIETASVRAGNWNLDGPFDPDAPELVFTARRPAGLLPSIPRMPDVSQEYPSSFTLRLIPGSEIRPQHAAIVSRIFCTSFGKNPKTGKPHVLGPARMMKRLENCSFLCLTLKNDVPVGYLFGTTYQRFLKIAWLDSICVLNAFRRQGLATAMLDVFARAVPGFEWLGATSPNPITKIVLQKVRIGQIYGPGDPPPQVVLDQLPFIQRECEDLKGCDIDFAAMTIRTNFSVEYPEPDRVWQSRDAGSSSEPPWWSTLANLPEDYESLLIIHRDARHLLEKTH